MTHTYPYRARSLMRFQAQDGKFILNADQLVTVTGPTEDAAEWLDVIDEQGARGSIPAGFMIPTEPETRRETAETISIPASTEVSSNAPEPADPLPTSQGPLLTPVASRVSLSSQTPMDSPTPSKGPPPPAAKPNALRDRIAMFNKAGPTAASPPPNTRPKPTIARKPINFPAPVPPIETSQENIATSSAASQEDTHATAQPGMSAADAEESVKASGSLKDRIRLLQQQQQAAAAPDSSSTPPKPKREWKRPPPQPVDESALPIPIGLPPSIQHEPTVEGDESTNHPVDEPEPSAIEDSADIAAEEEEELARRRRIAERMAKLGGAKMGFGFPGPAIAPKPTASPKHSTDTESLTLPSEESTAEEPASPVPPERITMPSIPKRAPPPRRKAPSPANVPAPSDPPLVPDAPLVSEVSPVSEAPPVLDVPVSEAPPVPDPPVSEAPPVSDPPVSEAPSVSNVPNYEASPVSHAPLVDGPPHDVTAADDRAPHSVEDTKPQASNIDEVLIDEVSSPVDDLVDSGVPLKHATQPNTTDAQSQPHFEDLASEPRDVDELPASSQNDVPNPANDLICSDAPQEEAALSPTFCIHSDPPSLQDPVLEEDNANQAIKAPPTELQSSEALDASPGDHQINEVSLQKSTVDDSLGQEHASSEPPVEAEKAVEEEEVNEEEEEMARRRKIAERMAKLGGAKIGFGFPGGPAMIPRPTGPPKQQSSASEASITQQSPKEPTTAEGFSTSSPRDRPPMPTRATPPTRKAPSPGSIVPVKDQSTEVADELHLDGPHDDVSHQLVDSTPEHLSTYEAPAPPSRPPPTMNSDRGSQLSIPNDDFLAHGSSTSPTT